MFNQENSGWKTGKYPLFCGEPLGLHDTINVPYPQLESLRELQVAMRWTDKEFDKSLLQSLADMQACPKPVRDVMLRNIAYQWPADSLASRAIPAMFGPFVTNSELWGAWMEAANMEVIHARTYGKIVQICLPDSADEVFKLVMENEQTLARTQAVDGVFDLVVNTGAEYVLGRCDKDRALYAALLGTSALYMLERVQFMASFAATFALVGQDWFTTIGTAVQKIMMDEIRVHAEIDKTVLDLSMKDKDSRKILKDKDFRGIVAGMLKEVIAKDVAFGDNLLSEGRSVVGYTPQLSKEWVLWNALPVAETLGIVDLVPELKTVKRNPLPWMDDWLDIDKRQNAQQEAQGNNYMLNTVTDDIGDEDLEV